MPRSDHPSSASTQTPRAIATSTSSARQRAYRWLALCFAGNVGLEVVGRLRKDPSWRDRWPLVLGSAPNLLAVAAIAGTLAAIALLSPPAAIGSWTERRRIHASVVIAVVGLLLWEVVQPLTGRLIFDWRDVGATLVAGALLAAFAPRGGGAGGADIDRQGDAG